MTETRTETDALEAFERLGLTSYEAKVFIALQQLGTGTARDIAQTTDVPRSQVYSVADALEGRGLLEVQQSSPIRYRPVSVDEARELLRSRFEREQERAFEYVETVRSEPAGEEEKEDIWTVRGRERVNDRLLELCERADSRILFGARLPSLVPRRLESLLEQRATAGLEVSVVSANAEVRAQLGALEGVDALEPPAHRRDDDRSGRILLVDDETLLLSVVDDDGTETAIWSAESLFASVLIELIEAGAEVPDTSP